MLPGFEPPMHLQHPQMKHLTCYAKRAANVGTENAIFLTVSIQRLRSTTFGVCVWGGGGGFAIFERDTQKQFSCFRAITSIITNRFVPALLGTQAAFRLHSV